jgi:hypothetical protein
LGSERRNADINVAMVSIEPLPSRSSSDATCHRAASASFNAVASLSG